MSKTNKALIYEKFPETWPVPGEHLVVKDIGFDVSSCPRNAINVEVLYLSLDPYMRGRMQNPSIKSYIPAFKLGEPVTNTGIARVLKSTSPQYQEGDIVKTTMRFQQFITIKLDDMPEGPKKIKMDASLSDLRHWLGALGMPGLTAYSSFYEIGEPQEGETIFISSAAGAVGQLVGQLAKHEGMTVIGSVGSDEKLEFLTEELGFDGGFNYKKEKPADALARLAPKGIDVYYDNVGGEQLSAAIDAMNNFGRIVACGAISQYNAKPEDWYGVKNLSVIIGRRISMRGFIVSDPEMGPKYEDEHIDNVKAWLKDGSFKAKVSETLGMDKAAEGLVGMFKGENFGKAVLKVNV